MKLLDSASLLAGPCSLKVQPGQYAGLVLRVAGTTAAADASATDVGLVTAYWRNRPFMSVRFTDLQTMCAMDLGQVEIDNTTPFNYAAAIISSRARDGNIFDVTDDDHYRIGVDLSGAGGVIGAAWTGGTIGLFGIPCEGPQAYMPQVFTHSESIANGSTEVIRLDYENMTHLYLTNLTNLDRVHLSLDGQELVDASVPELQAFSNMDARIESAFTTGLRINLHRSGSISESLSDSVVLKLSASGGAATPNIMAVALDFTPDLFDRSRRAVQRKADVRFARKAAEGKGRPVRVAEALR